MFVESYGEKYLNNDNSNIFINYNNTYFHIYMNEYIKIKFIISLKKKVKI